jgi:hypothetical protein
MLVRDRRGVRHFRRQSDLLTDAAFAARQAMSDVGLTFPAWFDIALVLIFALPLTSLVLAGLGVGWFASRRRGRPGRTAVLKWGAIAVAPFWLVGAGFGLWALTAVLIDKIDWARHHSTLATATVIDGVDIPAGATVSRDDDGALQTVDLAEGTTLTTNGATWLDHLEFAPPSDAPNGARGRIMTGTLAAAATIQGIPCQGGQTVDFLWGGELMDCTLATDAAVSATIRADGGGTRAQAFTCRGGATVALEAVPPGGLASCILAQPAEISAVACAGGAELQLSSGSLGACTLAKGTRFRPVDLPPGASVIYYEALPSSFMLAGDAGDVPAFGLALPGGTEATFCYKSDKLERLTVDPARSVTMAGVKLTRLVEFDCGAFHDGILFEDAVLRGKTMRAGEQVTRDDLFPPAPS